MMEWNVYREDFYSHKIYVYNIFDHRRFRGDIEELLHANLPRGEFTEGVRRTVQYYFWSKCEHEVVITSWPPYITEVERVRVNSEADKVIADGRINRVHNVRLRCGEKIDIYDQIMLNYDRFIDYLWMHSSLQQVEENN